MVNDLVVCWMAVVAYCLNCAEVLEGNKRA